LAPWLAKEPLNLGEFTLALEAVFFSVTGRDGYAGPRARVWAVNR
jgi:hypothetical protein